MDKAKTSEAVEKLLRQKLGVLYGWKAPSPVHNIGPHDIERFSLFEENVRHIEDGIRSAIEGLGNEELCALLANTPNDPTVIWFDDLLKNEIEKVAAKKPIWIAFGFGHPDHAADFNYWSKVGLLSVQEATLLSVGLDPNEEHLNFLERIRDAAGQPNKNAQAVFLSKRYRVIRDHYPFGVSSRMSIPPASFLNILKKIDLEVPEGLKSALACLGKTQENVGNAKGPASSSKLERDSMLKLIAAMACEQYNFDPKTVRSQAVPSLRQDLDSVGLSLDDKTIRKWLKEACELVPNEYWEKS